MVQENVRTPECGSTVLSSDRKRRSICPKRPRSRHKDADQAQKTHNQTAPTPQLERQGAIITKRNKRRPPSTLEYRGGGERRPPRVKGKKKILILGDYETLILYNLKKVAKWGKNASLYVFVKQIVVREKFNSTQATEMNTHL